MDLSTITRALESLRRRNPALSSKALELSSQLSSAKDEPSIFVNALVELLLLEDRSDSGNKVRWEPLAVGLFVAAETMQQQQKVLSNDEKKEDVDAQVYMEGPRVPTTNAAASIDSHERLPTLTPDESLHVCQTLHQVCLKHLEHDEPRIRTSVAKAVGAYCSARLPEAEAAEMRREMHARLVRSIHEHIAAGRDESGAYSRSSEGALDDTTGWRALETNWQCLASMISAMGGKYLTDFGLTDEILEDCRFSCVVHVNRHVRAAGMAVLEKCIFVAAASREHQAQLTESASPLRKTVTAVLKSGLADNWSQVRMAASVLCRVFLTSLQQLQSSFHDLFPVLLPRMCLNRFYLAQGVKLYSHETWKRVFEESGMSHVASNLPAICRYYVNMCDADNHVVREAACQAIAELAARLGEHETYYATFQPHVDLLLQALVMCFHDESWPVRDEACIACGILCRAYPEECRSELNTLWERWTEQLTDQIWSVRQDAAVGLGDALEAYGSEFLTKIRELISKLLPSAREQPAMTPAEYRARQNDPEVHTGNEMYSCGSLAPKMRKSGAGRIGGCSSCGVTRPKAPWEATDGCIYLIRELCIRCSGEDSATPMSDNEFIPLLRELADVCRVQHFPQADDLRATLWRQLPIMAEAFGKQRFKRHYLEIFMDLLFSNLERRTASQLSVHAAGQCAEELSKLVGVAIFRGRLDDYQQETFDRVMRERQQMPKGPPDAGFSPFGPPGLLDSVGKGGMHPGIGVGVYPSNV